MLKEWGQGKQLENSALNQRSSVEGNLYQVIRKYGVGSMVGFFLSFLRKRYR